MLKIHNQSTFRLTNVKKRIQEFEDIFTTLAKAYISTDNIDKHEIVLRYGFLEVLLVNANQMRSINQKQRGVKKQTDVLSFPLDIIEIDWHSVQSCVPKDFVIPLGSVVINVQQAKQCAKNFKHSFDDELKLLFIHALLHIFGFDHEHDKGEQQRHEQKWIEHFALPKSLITRTLE